MSQLKTFTYPDMPADISDLLMSDDKSMIIIGIIGKSTNLDCNKMAGLNLLKTFPSLDDNIDCKDGKIKFYFETGGNILYVHFETTFDNQIMENLLDSIMNDNEKDLDHFILFNNYIRTKFSRTLLFAIQICHMIVLVETGNVFDTSYLSIFKALKIIREKYILKFLPKILKNANVGAFMGKEGRLCSPRFIFLFEKMINDFKDNDELLNKYEFEVEDSIYKMLRNEFIITNNSFASLFSIPRNKRFVYYNTKTNIRKDPLITSIELLTKFLEKTNNKNEEDEFEEYRPFTDFAKPWKADKEINYISNSDIKNNRSIINLLKEHVIEALQYGFDDSIAKFRGKNHFVTPSIKEWYDTFQVFHKLFIENPDDVDFETNDSDYKAYLENFNKIMDSDERYFEECCEYGFELAIQNYLEILPHHYSLQFHKQKLLQSLDVYKKYARGPQIKNHKIKLKDACESFWANGKQQCEYPSLRGNPCVMAKHVGNEPSEHSSGVVYISTCNCGRTQGRREDPYTIKQANYDFYYMLSNHCTACNKLEKITFPIFQPSINDFKAAKLDKSFESKRLELTNSSKLSDLSGNSPHLTTSQNTRTNLSLDSMDDLNRINFNSSKNEIDKETTAEDDNEDNSVNEIVIKVGDVDNNKDKSILRQPSTTEYLPGMTHTDSPIGLLPQYPSWSLTCIGLSSLYSHVTGLPEHTQSGFLSGANFLLPWDVQVRLEHASSWTASYEKSRSRKNKPQQQQISGVNGSVFALKIFVGIEYECPCGHRFIMSGPNKILHGGNGIVRDNGHKVVFNDMPLYYPCPCRSTKPNVAQLMRIHVVTPKAPVNVILDPKVRPGNKNNLIFTCGLSEPAKLSQGAYWILRLPYIYYGDDGAIMPPVDIKPETSMLYGHLLAGMFGITEMI